MIFGLGIRYRRNLLVMSGMEIPVRSLFPIGFGYEEKSSPETENGDRDVEIFFRQRRV
jgi:hypothetical protein